MSQLAAPSFDALLRVDRENYWHAFTQMADYQPLVIDRADGVWLHDHLGRSLIDGVSSMWCNVHGHRHPQIDDAIKEQLDKVAHVTSLGASNSTVLKLTEKLVEITPAALECVFYSSDGSCAVEVALKMAFQYWRQCDKPEPQRSLFLAIGSSYHGDTLGSVSVGGVARFHAMFSPLLFDVVRGPCPDSYRVPSEFEGEPYTEAELAEHYLAQYRDLFSRFSEKLAAVVIEPIVQGAAGMVVHPRGFLTGLRKLAKEYSVLFIADEIAVGMGRTGHMWASELEELTCQNLSPDFLCMGKGLSGGYLPVAATMTTRSIWNAFLGDYSESKSFFHGHTYGGNPLGCAAAVATLELFDKENTLQNVADQADLLKELLKPIASLSYVGDVRQVGLLAAVELVANKSTKEPYDWTQRRGHRACEHALAKGVWLRPLGNSIVIVPPLCVRAEHIEQIVDAVQSGIQAAVFD